MRKSENDGEEFRVVHSRIPLKPRQDEKIYQAVSNCYAISLFELE